MIVHDTVHGFIVEREVPLPELDAVMYQMKHEKTGLELVWISREEENKVFGIGFETLPWNDTGVFHILEHSVLCGSKNYPVKEPFVELLKNFWLCIYSWIKYSIKINTHQIDKILIISACHRIKGLIRECHCI